MNVKGGINILTGYKLLEKLGEGTSGEVWKVEKDNRVYALKMYKAGFESQVFVEFETMQKIEHPNIVDEYEVGTFESRPCMVMEYLDGTPLTKTNPSDLSADQQEKIIASMASALQSAHDQNVIHRDLKPDNIFLLKDGTVKILDFGVSAPISYNPHTKIVAGSYSYMSPEQLSGKVNFQGDIWSFGVCLYEWYTGIHPYQSETLSELAQKMLLLEVDPPTYYNPRIPEKIGFIILKSLRNKLDERYSSFNEVLQDLQSNPVQQLREQFEGVNIFSKNILTGLIQRLKIKYALGRTILFVAPLTFASYLFNPIAALIFAILLVFLIFIVAFIPRLFPAKWNSVFNTNYLLILSLLYNKYQFNNFLKSSWSYVENNKIIHFVGEMENLKMQELLLKWFFKEGDTANVTLVNKNIQKINIDNEISLAYLLHDQLDLKKYDQALSTAQKLLRVNSSHAAVLIIDKILSTSGQQLTVNNEYQLVETVGKKSLIEPDTDYQSSIARQIISEGSCTLKLLNGSLKLLDDRYQIKKSNEGRHYDRTTILFANYQDITGIECNGQGIILDEKYAENKIGGLNQASYKKMVSKYSEIRFQELSAAKLWLEFIQEKTEKGWNNKVSNLPTQNEDSQEDSNPVLGKREYQKLFQNFSDSFFEVYQLLVKYYVHTNERSSYSKQIRTNPLNFDFKNKVLEYEQRSFLFFKKKKRVLFSEIESIKFMIDDTGERCIIKHNAVSKISYRFKRTDYKKYTPVLSAFWGDKIIFENKMSRSNSN